MESERTNDIGKLGLEILPRGNGKENERKYFMRHIMCASVYVRMYVGGTKRFVKSSLELFREGEFFTWGDCIVK